MKVTEQLFTREQAALYINKTISALNTMATRKRDVLPFERISGKTYYTKSTLDAFACSPV